MAPKKHIAAEIARFCAMLASAKVVNIKSAYLFGSTALGTDRADSDIDVAIVSDSFTGFRYSDRAKINPFVLKTNTKIEVHPFTVKEFKTADPFVREILRTGKRVY